MRETIKKALYYLEMAYKQKGFSISDKDKDAVTFMVNTWLDALKDIPPHAIETAVMAWVQSQSWAPTPADIRSMVVETGVKSATEAWEEVTVAICKYGAKGGKDALAGMSDTTRRIVKSIGWRNLCLSESVLADRAHFMRMYKELSNKEEKLVLMSPEVRDAIMQIGSAIRDNKSMLE